MVRALLLPAVFLLASCESPDATPVRATLGDGQVMVGQVRTDTLWLEGDLGTIPIPLADVGEVLPVEGAQLEGSGGYVTVWLRNGSEFRGRWADPELAMELSIGGEGVEVDLPAESLTRFQLQGGTVWPSQPVFRVTTLSGDDFLVDPEASRIAITNELGSFAPYLSECQRIERVGEQWQLTLHTGTVLLGTADADALDFALELGPETVTVPLDRLEWMQWEAWSGGGQAGYVDMPVASPEASEAPARASSPPSTQSIDRGDGWFSNEQLFEAKH